MNKLALLRRKGSVLLETLIISLLLSYISVMVMKWVLARYSLATHAYLTNIARGHAGYVSNQYSMWDKPGINPGGSTITVPDGSNKTVTVGVSGPVNGIRTITTTTSEDY